jgi:hypothetical protein
MKNEKKDKLFEEGLKKFKYRVGYKINETPRYRPLVGANETFDNLPERVYNTEDGLPMPAGANFQNEAGDQEDAEKPGGGVKPTEPSTEVPPGIEQPPAGEQPAVPPTPPEGTTTSPEGGGKIEGEPLIGGPQASDPMGATEPVQQVDDVQNDIIKHNIAAMQSIDDQLKSLNATVDGLNAKLESLNSDVEEVREPTNTEKLMSKKNVSYPYYFNLNDFWTGNWFDEKRSAEHEKGVRELPDGSFIADFDDLPQKSKTDVQNSFNEYE